MLTSTDSRRAARALMRKSLTNPAVMRAWEEVLRLEDDPLPRTLHDLTSQSRAVLNFKPH